MLFVSCLSLLGPSSATKKGFWFAQTCAFSLYLFQKILMIFYESK